MNIPKGFKLVPIEPTEEMVYAMATAIHLSKTSDQVYLELIAAAPAPPQHIYDEAKERELFEAEFPVPEGLVFDQDRNQYYGAPTYWFQQAQWEAWQKCAHSIAKSVELAN